MPHIFFERLEQRKNTQSLLGFSSEFLGNTNLFGTSPYSFYPSVSPVSSYGSYFPYQDLNFQIDPIIRVCYVNPFPVCYIPTTLLIPIPDPTQVFRTDIWTSPVTNPLFNNFSQPYSLTPAFTSPYSSGNVFSPGLNVNPLSSPFSGSNVQAPYLGQDILPSSRLDSSTLPVMDVNQERISKLGKVRENLIAFFRNKGILNDKQRQRLLS